MKQIFDQAAKQGVAMSRAIVYASRDSEINYWPDRHWEKMFIRNTEFMNDGHTDIDARTLWHYQAICVSPNLLSTTPGVGTAYLTSFRDKAGAYLLGDTRGSRARRRRRQHGLTEPLQYDCWIDPTNMSDSAKLERTQHSRNRRGER